MHALWEDVRGDKIVVRKSGIKPDQMFL